MTPRGWFRGSAAAVALLAAAACGDLPSAAPSIASPVQPAAGMQALTCRATVADRAVTCGPGLPSGATGDLIIGGQHQYLDLMSDSIAYDSATAVFSFVVSVHNLMPQPLGTTDGTTPDSGGVKVFFHSLPVVNNGTGVVAVLNADGLGTFTAAGQPFFRYAEIVQPGAVTAVRRWSFSVPATVVSFVFTLYVDAAVPRPQGWVRADLDTMYLVRTSSRALQAVVVTATGSPTDMPVGWSVEDTTLAKVSGSTVTGKAVFGTTRLFATAPGLADTVVLKVGLPGFVKIAAGNEHTCALDAQGHAFCWGTNGDTWVGADTYLPKQVRQGSARFTDIDAGQYFTCALTAAGQTWCWGTNRSGQLGNGGPQTPANDPVQVAQGGVAYARISVGTYHACGLAASGQAWCWGSGYGSRPTAVAQAGLVFVRLVAGQWRSCGLTQVGQTWCWGTASPGVGSNTPAPVDQSGRTYVELAGGPSSICGITAAHQAYCWGENASGGLGLGNTATPVLSPLPVQQSGLGYTQVTLGYAYGCALATTSEAYCWGANYEGQNGIGHTPSSASPKPVDKSLNATWTTIHAGYAHTCGLSSCGDAYCWGWNSRGQLGIGTLTDPAYAPLLVKR